MKTRRLFLFFFCCLFIVKGTAQKFLYTYKGVTFSCKAKRGAVCITGFDVDAEDVVIPAVVKNGTVSFPVREVSTYVSGNNYYATEITIEEGVEYIGNYCFNEFRNLEKATLPSTIKRQGKNAFRKGVLLVTMNPQKVPDKSNDYLAGDNDIDEEYDVSPMMLFSSEQNVDKDIPVAAGKENDDVYCVIIANENYKHVPHVSFALNDGRIFREYCIKTLGIPAKNVKSYSNASFTDMRTALNIMEKLSEIKKGYARFIFYYAGHGIPNTQDKTAYLLPVDAYPGDMETCVHLKELYTRFGRMQGESVLVLLDACFSGLQRGNGGAIVDGRGIIRVRNEVLTGNVVSFSAASGDEIAMSYQGAKHGMFTYHLLHKLKSDKGEVTLGELVDYVKEKVAEDALLVNNKSQTPSILVAPSMKSKWEKIKY